MARTELQVLLNDPVTFPITTRKWKKPVKCTIQEPTNAELGEYLALIGVGLQKFLGENGALLSAAFNGDTKTIAKTQLDLSQLPTSLYEITAKIVRDGTGKPFTAQDVHLTMSAKQQMKILQVFGEVLGWEFIKETFLKATRNLMASTKPSGNVAAPSWARPSSSTSPESSRTSRPTSSGGNVRTGK